MKLVVLTSLGVIFPTVLGAVTPNALEGRSKDGVLVRYPGVSEAYPWQ